MQIQSLLDFSIHSLPEVSPLELTKSISKQPFNSQESENSCAEQDKTTPFQNTLSKISSAEDKILFMQCSENMPSEDLSNFCNVTDFFVTSQSITGLLKFLKPVLPDKRFCAALLVKKIIDYHGSKRNLYDLFANNNKCNNKNVLNIIENAEKLFRNNTTISEKVLIIKKLADASSESKAREIFVSLTKRLLNSEPTSEYDLQVINCLEKIDEASRASTVELAYNFFDKPVTVEIKLLILEELSKIKAEERKSACQFVKQILPKENTPISGKLTVLKKLAGMSGNQARGIFAHLTMKLLSNEKTGQSNLRVVDCLGKIDEESRPFVVGLAHQFFHETIEVRFKLLVLEEIIGIKENQRKSICQFVKQLFPNEISLQEIISGIQCFKEINPRWRNIVYENTKTYFEENNPSRTEKIRYMREVQAEHLIDNVLK